VGSLNILATPFGPNLQYKCSLYIIHPMSGNNIERPEGFPLSEEEYRQMRLSKIAEIVDMEHRDTYSEWCLRGAPGKINPLAALAVFPTIANTSVGYVFEKEELTASGISKDAKEYWQEAKTLALTKRVQSLEQSQYQQATQFGDQILEKMMLPLTKELMPSAIILFSKLPDASEESIFLISPTLIPPSAALKHFLQQAQ
jgi:hypothetical protein